ncbi:TetR/AcrR family transcriptional regulator [Rhodophyticola porphyridii]|uniref:TetR/AcrR family transcriptional regulator n=1 Tax=Rhodophyticola porphyridii TaxID=1852017 RepID=A0A3L9Y6E4_9RHOB|nr:TetR/AcrR family transcriptional regulator [Rhodophyticola porphyridii]RMA41686.1 TetR/AcrR family transcriptional regulator [Rhodophyticola porphyridii]
MKSQLKKTDWLDLGLKTLATSGAVALKAAPLAERLSVTRGSFYWHFEDIDQYHSELLEYWRERMTTDVIAANDSDDPVDKLSALLNRAFSDTSGIERAIRAWAIQDEKVAQVVGIVDQERIEHIRKLLLLNGVVGSEAHSRAILLYWTYVGRQVTFTNRGEKVNRTVPALIERMIVGP